MLRNWLRRLRQRRSLSSRPTRRPHAPRLEGLETRLVPAAVSRAGTGADTAALTPIFDQFRTDLGGVNNGGGPAALTGRREINWDGIPDGIAAPNFMPGNQFAGRGALFATPGTNFQVSADSANPTLTPVRFDNLNATYSAIFKTFSAERLFTALGSNITDVTFVVPATATPATVTGFGAVFTDVDSASSTTLEFFDQAGASLGTFPVPALNAGLSFLGVSFNAGERVARVRITSGNVAPGPNDDGTNDIVVMDDFVYGEPQPVRFQFSAATYSANETGGTAFVTVTRINGTFGAASVVVNTVDATAQAGSDYTAIVNQTLNFVTGEASKTIAIPIHDDVLAEGLETITLTLSMNSPGTVLGTPSLAIVTLLDNETPPVALLGLTSNNKLVRFDAANPGTILSTVTVTGLQAGEVLRGMDFRPATGVLYALGSTGRLYTVNPTSGAATQVGADPLSPLPAGAAFGIDFNPLADRLRIVSDTDQNLRVQVDTPTVFTDTALAFAPGDPNAAANPNVVGSAYTNNFAGATVTTLFGIDSNLDILVRQGGPGGTPSPNGGQLFTIGQLGFNVQDLIGFDISAIGNQAFAAFTLVGEATPRLFALNLAPVGVAPAANSLGAIGGPDALLGLAIIPPGSFQFSQPAYAVNENGATATITVTRTGGSDGVATVNFTVAAGSAVAGTDFVAASGVLVFNNGETTRTFTVAVTDDTAREGAETVLLSLTNPSGGAVLGTRSTATLTILDNESPAPLFYALTDVNKLLRIDAAAPGTAISTVTITGLQAGETVLGIDYRPANGTLYALGSTSRLYTVNPTSGAATQVGTGQFEVLLDGTAFGFDFNPAADRIRVVSNTGQNLRLNPDTGAVVDGDAGTAGVQPDTPLAYALNDVNFGLAPAIVGAGYTNNVAGTTVTTLFGIDATRGQLVRQGGPDGTPSPNGGQLTTLGNLGFATQTLVGFDIGADGSAFVSLTSAGDTVSKLYQVNLTTGVAIYLGDLPGTELIRGMTLVPAGIVQFSAATANVAENAGTVTLTITRTAGSDGAITVGFTTSDGTGKAGIDYTATTGTVTFAAGETSKTFTVAIRDNGRADGSRTFNVTLTTLTGGAAFGVTTAAVVTITDNDAALTQNERFVTQAYFDLLNRLVDPGGLTTWTTLLNSGGTRDQVARGIVNSVEYKTVVVRGLYLSFLRRDPDAGGLNSYVTFLVNGGTVEAAIASIVGSVEYFNGPGGGTNDTFLVALYQDILGRPIDPAGQASFSSALASGTSRQQVASIILASQEYFQVLVNDLYVRLLGRTADPGGLSTFVTFMQQGGRQEDVIVALTASPEYFARV